jgi:hypothetical protein
MALSASTVFEVRYSGSDTNGGGFVTGASGTDWSQQNTAQYAVTDGVTAGTTTITSATANFGTDVVGNIMYVQGGSGSVVAGWYQITSRTNSTTIVVDRSTGLTAGTGVTLNIGGALATPGNAGVLLTVAGQKAWWKYNASTYTMSTATVGAGGPITLGSANVILEGYDATRGDRTTNRPKISWGNVASPGSNTYICVGNSAQKSGFINLIVDCNQVANVSGINAQGATNQIDDCVVRNANQTGCIGINCGGNVAVHRCQVDTCTTGIVCTGNGKLADCDVTNCTTGISGMPGAMRKTLIRGCGTGVSTSANVTYWERVTVDGCTTAGADVSSSTHAEIVGCLFSNNTGGGNYGIKVGGLIFLEYCAFYNNTTNVSGTAQANENSITISNDPYFNHGSNDFRPNATAAAGLLLWNACPGVFGQTDNADVGAVQHTDPTTGPTGIVQRVYGQYTISN